MAAHPITFFLHLQNTIKLYHWMTTSHARHVAADKLFEGLVEIGDTFIEAYIGKYSRPKVLSTKDLTAAIQQHTDQTILELFDHAEKYLQKDIFKYINEKKDLDLMNIRDDVLTMLSQSRYLFTLK
jgi:hypothetical protein